MKCIQLLGGNWVGSPLPTNGPDPTPPSPQRLTSTTLHKEKKTQNPTNPSSPNPPSLPLQEAEPCRRWGFRGAAARRWWRPTVPRHARGIPGGGGRAGGGVLSRGPEEGDRTMKTRPGRSRGQGAAPAVPAAPPPAGLDVSPPAPPRGRRRRRGGGAGRAGRRSGLEVVAGSAADWRRRSVSPWFFKIWISTVEILDDTVKWFL